MIHKIRLMLEYNTYCVWLQCTRPKLEETVVCYSNCLIKMV